MEPILLKSWVNQRETKSYAGNTVELPVNGSLGELLGISNSMTHQQAFKFYRECQAVATVIDGIAEHMADLPIYLEIEDEVVTEHPLLDLLQTPHPEFTGRLFLTVLATHYLLTGECYFFMGGNFRMPPRMLAPISPCNVSAVQASDGFIGGFVVGGMVYGGQYNRIEYGGHWLYMDNNQKVLKQIRRFSTHDNSQLYGESKLLSAAADVRQNLAGSIHNLTTLIKGGRLSLVFSIHDDMDPIKFQNAKNEIIARYSGAQGNSIAVVKAEQMSIQEMGTNNKDMDFANLQQMTEKAVAKRYGYPLQLINDGSSTYNNLSTAYEALYDNCVVPVSGELFDGISHCLMPRFNLDPKKTKICVDTSSIPSIALRNAEIALKRRSTSSWTENELRQTQGLDPIENGDDIYRPANLVKEETEEQDNQQPRPINDNLNDDE